MDDIIQRIIDFEKKAQNIVGAARKERQVYEDTMHSEIESFREKTTNENNAEIESYNAQMKREADEGVKHLEDAAKLKIVQMQKIATSQRDEWIEYLYNKIVSGGRFQ